jgi:hypothetical protein
VEICRDRLKPIPPNAFGAPLRLAVWRPLAQIPHKKPTLLDVADRWLVLARVHEREPEDVEFENIAGW